MSKYYSRILFNMAKDVLDGKLRYTENSENGWIFIDGKPPKFNGRIRYIISFYDDSYNVYSFLDSVQVDTSNLTKVSAIREYICSVNEGRMNGNFDLKMNTGSILYRTFTYCPHEELNGNLLLEDLGLHEHMYERFGNEMMAVYYGNMTAKEAFDRAIKND